MVDEKRHMNKMNSKNRKLLTHLGTFFTRPSRPCLSVSVRVRPCPSIRSIRSIQSVSFLPAPAHNP